MIGKIPDDVLKSLIETIPIEFSILDKDDNVMAWNKHETRIFKRPESVLGMNVRNCHPKKSLEKVERIINEMKDGKRNMAEFYIDLALKDGVHKILIRYFALRDEKKNYLGCLEATQDITHIQSLNGEKRLLD
jgi:PAS domain S-box-containing protein